MTNGREFLNRFAENKRSLVANRFLAAYRKGITAPSSIVAAVRAKARINQFHGDPHGSEALLIETIDAWPTEAAAYAAYCEVHENRTPEQKEQDKLRRFYESQPPTEKQVAYLRHLGETRTPRNKAEASDWISARVNRNGA